MRKTWKSRGRATVYNTSLIIAASKSVLTGSTLTVQSPMPARGRQVCGGETPHCTPQKAFKLC